MKAVGLALSCVLCACSFDGNGGSGNVDASSLTDSMSDGAVDPDAALGTTPIVLSGLEVSGPGFYDDPMLASNGDIYFAGPGSDIDAAQDLFTAKWDPLSRTFATPTKLPGNVNTPVNESTIWIAPDALLLLYARRGENDVDIEYATRPTVNDDFVAQGLLPQSSPQLLHSSATDALGALTSDGLSLFFVSDRDGEFNLFEATRSNRNSAFNTVTILMISDSEMTESSIKLSGDDLTLFYAIQEPDDGGPTEKNIFVATRANKDMPFSNPTPLDSINTPGFDDDFAVHPAGSRAVFSSNRLTGGDPQIFMVEPPPS